MENRNEVLLNKRGLIEQALGVLAFLSFLYCGWTEIREQ
jgi:hypothetical protein